MAEQEKEKVKSQNVMSLDLGTAFSKLSSALGRMLARLVSGSVVTIDISQTGIRLMETRGGTVRRWADASFEAEEMKPATHANEATLSAQLRQLMHSSGIRAKKVIASISGMYTVSRFIPMSSLPPGPTLEESVNDIAQHVMPVPTENLYFFWQTVSPSEGEQQVFTVGVPRDVIDGQIRALKMVGVNPEIIELRAMALARAVNKEQALILNIEPANFDVIMVVKGVPEIMHSLAWRQDSGNTEDAAEYLATNLEMTVDFYNGHHVSEPFDMASPLYITGQMSAEPELMEKLRARLGYNIEPLTPPLECPVLLPVSQYAVNFGLAMRQEMALRNNAGKGGLYPLAVNLLPRAYQPWRPTAKQIYSVIILIAAIALIFPLSDVTAEARGKTIVLERKAEMLDNQLLLKKTEIEKREPLQRAISEYSSIVTRKGSINEDIRVIVEEAEKLGVTVSSITHGRSEIGISCAAEDYMSFRAYLTALEESGRFTTPIPPPEGYPYTSSGAIKLQTKSGE